MDEKVRDLIGQCEELRDRFYNTPRWQPDVLRTRDALKEAEDKGFKRGQEEMRERAAQLLDDAECPETCSSLMHDDICPYVNPGPAVRALPVSEEKP